jgi:hypothetical protein
VKLDSSYNNVSDNDNYNYKDFYFAEDEGNLEDATSWLPKLFCTLEAQEKW